MSTIATSPDAAAYSPTIAVSPTSGVPFPTRSVRSGSRRFRSKRTPSISSALGGSAPSATASRATGATHESSLLGRARA